jgi:hypothetical protein
VVVVVIAGAVVVVIAGAVVVVVAPVHIPLTQIWSGPQHTVPQQCCPTEALQQALVHSSVPAGQKHSHVVELKLAPGLQAMHRLVAAQRLLPLGHAHSADVGEQNPPQHSALCLHRCPTSLQRAAWAVLTSSSMIEPTIMARTVLASRKRSTDVDCMMTPLAARVPVNVSSGHNSTRHTGSVNTPPSLVITATRREEAVHSWGQAHPGRWQNTDHVAVDELARSAATAWLVEGPYERRLRRWTRQSRWPRRRDKRTGTPSALA